MGNIRLLEENVRELISAGEVVERPASAVKELVENALDAGADKIEVELRRSGLGSIRVTDNGKGIEKDDIKRAFLRHATSKIREASDLDAIGSLGFRGEALAAIAAVSRTELITRTAEDAVGHRYALEGGREVAFEECGAPFGTTITVSDLFFNTPARMKFLKKDVAEGNAVEQLLWHMALTEPAVSLRFIRDGRSVFCTAGQGLYAAVFELFPRAIAFSMREIKPIPGAPVQVSGYISAPRDARASRSMQHISVNGRYIKSRSIQAAAEEACRSFVMQGRYPAFALAVTLPLDEVDVNVHPAKTEIRFRSERAVTGAVYNAVRAAVSASAAAVPELAGLAGEPAQAPAEGVQAELQPAPEQLAFSGGPAAAPFAAAAESAGEPQAPGAAAWEAPSAGGDRLPAASPVFPAGRSVSDAVMRPLMPKPAERFPRGDEALSAPPFLAFSGEEAPPPEAAGALRQQRAAYDAAPAAGLRVLGEAFKTYIVAEAGDQLLLIDMHAAHERILFEKLRAAGGPVESQLLLEPICVSLDPEEKRLLLENAAALEKLGFTVEPFGEREVAVRAAPSYLKTNAVAPAVTEMAAGLAAGRETLTFEAREWLLHSVACRAAIKAGHIAPPEEMAALAEKILLGEVPKYCPHGRPVYIAFSKYELEKRFGRVT